MKHPEWSVGALAGYSQEDWRDPFVFRTKPGQPWQMLLATRRQNAPYRRSGVVARLTSDDLVQWSDARAFWDPHRFITQECPDVFQWGDWWYLVYSEFSDSFQTRYRIADGPNGPWRAPQRDTIDGRAFYASKTIELGGERYFIGWIATKEGERDEGAWQWAGDMSVLRARQQADGSLAFALPQSVIDSYTHVTDIRAGLRPLDGADDRVGAGATTRYSAWVGPELPTEAMITAEFDIRTDTQACGVLLRCSDDAEEAYAFRLEPLRNRVVLDRWPRGTTGSEQWQIRGDEPHAAELERPVPLTPGRHTLEIQLDHDICVAVIDSAVVLSARLYDRLTGRIGVFANDGAFDLVRLDIRERQLGPSEEVLS